MSRGWGALLGSVARSQLAADVFGVRAAGFDGGGLALPFESGERRVGGMRPEKKFVWTFGLKEKVFGLDEKLYGLARRK